MLIFILYEAASSNGFNDAEKKGIRALRPPWATETAALVSPPSDCGPYFNNSASDISVYRKLRLVCLVQGDA